MCVGGGSPLWLNVSTADMPLLPPTAFSCRLLAPFRADMSHKVNLECASQPAAPQAPMHALGKRQLWRQDGGAVLAQVTIVRCAYAPYDYIIIIMTHNFNNSTHSDTVTHSVAAVPRGTVALAVTQRHHPPPHGHAWRAEGELGGHNNTPGRRGHNVGISRKGVVAQANEKQKGRGLGAVSCHTGNVNSMQTCNRLPLGGRVRRGVQRVPAVRIQPRHRGRRGCCRVRLHGGSSRMRGAATTATTAAAGCRPRCQRVHSPRRAVRTIISDTAACCCRWPDHRRRRR